MFRECWSVIKGTSWRDWVAAAGILVAYHVMRGTVRERCRELHLTIEAARMVELAALRGKGEQ